ncbi:high light inducible protein [Prochlorococcus sp. MIT 1223]|uniref:high light inducible protein n=1 Tax=Prochlorococcus sp. MIT 1223 TaxID=3096217 RepID=UPI002A7480A9|nr:high light inducible protein [Prochlorococcus sp. MIT 1223]
MKQDNDYLGYQKDNIELETESSIENKTKVDFATDDLIENAKWINNQGNEVKEVFGFNENAELVNARAAMFGFAMLILTELVFKGEAATKSIFGIGL